MNILITGSLGHLAVNFIKLYYESFDKLVLVDAVSYCSNDKAVIPISDRIVNIYEDLNNIDILETLEKYEITILLHCAASTQVERSYTNYHEFINNNIFAVNKILEACNTYRRLTKMIHISSNKIYGGNLNRTFNEESKFNPINPYGSSKVSSEMIINALAYSYKLPVVIIRPSNLFGKYQYREKAIPKFIYKLLNNKPITIYGNGNQVRDFMYVEDMCKAIKFIIDSNITNGTYNVGVDNPIDINELAYIIFIEIKKKRLTNLNYGNYKVNMRDKSHDGERYRLNCRKLQSLGFVPNNNWKENLLTTINFYCDKYKKN